jgi:3-oxoadipate enol-lactonase
LNDPISWSGILPPYPHNPDTTKSQEIYYDVYGKGSAVLMIHGFAVRGDMFNPILRHYLDDFRVVLPDLRGFARSSHVRGPIAIRDHAADMVRLLDKLDIAQAHIIGYSMGGLVAQQLAIEYPDRVKALVLGCSWSYKSQTPGEMMLEILTPIMFRGVGAQRALDFVYDNVAQCMGLLKDPKLAAWYREAMTSTPDHRLADGARELYHYDSRAKLRHIKAPALVVAGDADQVVPYYHAEHLARMIRTSELHTFEGAGHGLIFSQPDRFAAISKEFLQHHQ